jgi:hypothetical protein
MIAFKAETFARAESFVHQLQRDLERCAVVHAARAAIIGELDLACAREQVIACSPPALVRKQRDFEHG